MDLARPKSQYHAAKRYAWITGCALAVATVAVCVALLDFSTERVDRSKIEVAEVHQGVLEIKVRGNGQLLPRNVEYIAAQIGGRVTKKRVHPGDTVKAGDVLLEMANPQVLSTVQEAQSAWEGGVIELQAAKSSLQTDLADHEITLAQTHFNLQSAMLQLQAETQLVQRALVPVMQFKRTQLTASQLEATLGLQEGQVKAIRANIGTQLAVKQAHITELAEALSRAKNAAANLQIKAGTDGTLQALSADIGQELVPGQSVGRIAKPAPLYAELKVAARDGADLQLGQKVVVDTHADTIEGVVSRIDPGITEGTVVIDVTLTRPPPPGARPQLAVDGDIYILQLPDTLYVGKPPFVQANADVPIYRLEASRKYADRVIVRSGKLSLTQMQVVSGLKAGDLIITSDSAEWQNQNRIHLD